MNLWQSMQSKIAERAEMKRLSEEEYIGKLSNATTRLFDTHHNRSGNFVDPVELDELEKEYAELYYNAKSFSSSIKGFFKFNIKNATNEFVNQYEHFKELAQEKNERLAENILPFIGESILPVEGRNLDNQQLKSIAKDVESHLVVAGAGTGKTTTIIGYVKYLLKLKKVEPEDILVLSFTNASAAEMSERIEKETGFKMDVSTFHKLGMNIITEVENRKPTIYSESISRFIKATLNELVSDAKYFRMLCSYIAYYSEADKSEFEFESETEYEIYLKANPPTSLKGEKLKSYGEMLIANFLAMNGINYIYEDQYHFDTATKEHSQYKPDFYLPDYDVYIEYFGINREGKVASYFKDKDGVPASVKYRESMEWKRKTHKEHGTHMIELFAYEHFENSLLESLSQKLKEFSVAFNPLSNDDLWKMVGNKKLDSLVELFGTIINLMKNNDCDFDEIERRNASLPRPLRLNIIVGLLKPIMSAYQDELKNTRQIDFNDMINIATKYVEDGKYQHHYKYVIVDEYQDISQSRFKLLYAMRQQSKYRLFCVGDDWQSIYRFAGSDIGFILSFEKYWGPSLVDRIETTYRFPQSLIEVSGSFIMQNPAQIKKKLMSKQNAISFAVEEIQGFNDKFAVQFMEKSLKDLPQNATVLLLGRYNFDVRLLDGSSNFDYNYDNSSGKVKVRFKPRKDLDITFMSAHGSKGLQADYVYILNNHNRGLGFPSRITDAPILDLLLDNTDTYPFAEERRLFYVALTRAKKKTFLLTVKGDESIFAQEIKETYGQEMRKARFTCPQCGGKLIKKHGKYGDFWGCENYNITGCKYIRSAGK